MQINGLPTFSPSHRASSLDWSAPPGVDQSRVSDLVDLSPPTVTEPAVSGRSLGKAGLWGGLLVAVAAAGVLTGCGLPSEPPAEPEVSQVDPGTSANIQVLAGETELAVELVPVEDGRVDIIRQTHTEEDENGESHTVEDPYSPIGVHLGGGLFYDLNGNLSLVPTRAFEAPVAGEFTRLEIDPPGWGNDKTTLRVNGSRVTVDPPGWSDETSINLSGDRAEIDPPGFSNTLTITRNSNRVTIDPPGWGNDIVVEYGPTSVTVDPSGFGNTTTVRLSENTIVVDGPAWSDNTDITRNGGTIKVDPDGWSNTTEIRHRGNRTTFDGPNWNDETEVTVDGNRTEIDGPNWNDTTTITRR